MFPLCLFDGASKRALLAAVVETCRDTVSEPFETVGFPNVQAASLGNPLHENVIELVAKPEIVSIVDAEDPGAAMLRLEGFAETAAATIVRERLAVPVRGWLSESLTVTVKLLVPACVGVPEIAPVVAFRVRPAGKAPAVTLQL
jgi:hypothetical protein